MFYYVSISIIVQIYKKLLNNYYMEDSCKYYFQIQHKKSDQHRSITITQAIIPFQTISKA